MGWLFEFPVADGVPVALDGLEPAKDKLAQVDGLVARRREAVSLGMPSFPDVAGRTGRTIRIRDGQVEESPLGETHMGATPAEGSRP